ncbi:DHA2 family efflux MFS transporter permease subunit [Heyndrickxia ginsengihumi]|uniref:MFS transporter n=1 Tax=Heyndrickxia ginsengihumi TaxID=363870 RepID=A0A0A6VJL8_9BACI|nr:DHA2 family efflux MFS transporter permease subunit [Heyndrickxia ginsengihumi]KHD86789.1 MFS transporter [Heyndrickxia ginsengihumi]MBE6183320.1 DHA2 family efflux MFS transporter permease subunit [Bacillus sp. (in: firmicutes)]NEY18499.1 DHA2 family efflux MFS transporter permease subunit [Heyndrickxia ginsengihumi]
MESESTVSQSVKIAPFFAVMMLGALVAFLNQTLINIALPQIMNHLHITAATANWLSTIYMLTNGIVIPITAYLMSRFTTRQLFLASMGLFTIGTLICAVAPGFSVLLIGRVVQAVGAGIIMPLMINVIFILFPPHRRGFAMGIFGVAMNFAPAIGPTLSGWIVENHSWRTLFFVILPIAVIDLIGSMYFVKNVTETSRPKLDRLGVMLSTLGFGGILYGFSTSATKGWSSTEVILTLVIGAIFFILFVWRQFAIDHPILEFRIFRYSTFTLTMAINIIVTMALFSGMILMPIYMQNARGFSPIMSGLLLLPGGIIMGIMSPITGKLFDRFGAKWLAIIGLLITAITTYALTKLELTTSFTYVVTVYTIRSFGISILMMPIFTAGLNDLPLHLNKFGTAMVNTFRMVAGAVGTAFFVSVMTTKGVAHTKDIMVSKHVLPTDKLHAAVAAKEGAVMGINDAFMVATYLAFLALVLSLFIKNTVPKSELPNEAVKQAKVKAVTE